MDKRKFESLKILNGDTNKSLSEYLGYTEVTICRKVNNGTLSMSDISKIKERWNLTEIETCETFLNPIK